MTTSPKSQPATFRLETLANGILRMTFPDYSAAVVDAGYAAVRFHEDQAIAAHRHIRVLLDLRGAGALTSYALKKLYQAVYATPPGLVQSYAALLDTNPQTRVVQIALKSLPKWIMNDDLQIFFSEETALAWLEKRRKERGD
jgi:hypothetical protein